MEMEKLEVEGERLSIAEAFGSIPDPRVAGRSKRFLVEMLVLAVCGVGDFVGIEAWGNEQTEWLRHFLKLDNGIPSRYTLGLLFGLLDPRAVEKSFRNWVSGVVQGLAKGSVVAI